MSNYVIYNFYKIFRIENICQMKRILRDIMLKNCITGTIIVSPEGITGAVCSQSKEKTKSLFTLIRSQNQQNDLICNKSFSYYSPFTKLKLKTRSEVVSINMKIKQSKENEKDSYVSPHDWNNLILDPSYFILDVRNSYETSIGTFRRSINLNIDAFRNFPKFLAKRSFKKDQKIAMFCTGGVRCEKTTYLLKNQGFKNVFQLRGGILNYLNSIPIRNSLWFGECFTFDSRLSIKYNLKEGKYSRCQKCYNIFEKVDKNKLHNNSGISCQNCFYAI